MCGAEDVNSAVNSVVKSTEMDTGEKKREE
jgi:hypothetical protein